MSLRAVWSSRRTGVPVASHVARPGLLATVLPGLLVTVLLGLLGLLAAPAAGAHATVIATSPANGSALTAAPSQVRLVFDNPVVVTEARGEVSTSAADVLGPLVFTPATGTGREATEIVATLPKLGTGVYRVSWRTVAADDRHNLSGTLTFGVGTAAAVTQPDPPSGADPWESLSRGVALLALTLLCGGPLAALLIRRRLGDTPPAGQWSRACLDLAFVGGLVALAAEVAMLLSTGLLLGENLTDGVATVLGSGYGTRWLLRAALITVAIVTVRALRRATPRRAALVVAAILAVVVVEPATSHLAGHRDLLAVPAAAAHLAAAAGWVGGLLCLGLVVLRGGRATWPQARVVLAGFAWIAAPAVSVLVISGLLLTGWEIAAVGDLVSTPYGVLLLVKVGLAALAGLFGLHHALRLHAGGPTRSVRRGTLITEAALAAAVVIAAAAVGSAQPPRGAAFEPVEAVAAPLPVTTQVGDLLLTLGLFPATIGDDLISLRVLDTSVPPGPAPTAVTLTLIGSGEPAAAMRRSPDGSWLLATHVTQAGPLRMRAVVTRPGAPDAVIDAAPQISAVAANARSGVRLSGWAFGAAAAALLVGLLVAAGVLQLTRRRRRGSRRVLDLADPVLPRPSAGPAHAPPGTAPPPQLAPEPVPLHSADSGRQP